MSDTPAVDLSAVKLIVADMDGTLLNSRHEVSARFLAQFEALDRRGYTFVAASGRQYHSIVDKLAAIAPRITAAAENGAYVVAGGEELMATPLPAGAHREVLDLVAPHPQIHPVICTKEAAYVCEEAGDFRAFMAEYYTSHATLADLRDYDGEILKIALYHADDSERYVYPHVRDLQPRLKVKVSGPKWVDISHPDAHKGHALAFLQARLGVLPAETLAFGDYNNDLEMLALADFSFAMANAHPNVRAAARYQAGSNDEEGVEEVLAGLLG